MNLRHVSLGFALVAGLCGMGSIAHAQSTEGQTVMAATEVFRSFTEFKTRSIPQSMLADAQAVAIIPNVVKGGFIVAGRFGRGILLVRDAPTGLWRAPVFVTFTGGSVGWQVGLQSTDVVLVFKNRKGLESMLNGSEFTLGADASVAAGPVGRQASAGTDIKLNAEIYSYSRSRGLFAGVALDGSVLKVDNRATSAFYVGGAVPPPAQQIAEMVARETVTGAPSGPPPGMTAVVPPAALPAMPLTASPDQLRAALVDSSRRLDPLVDDNWRKYLALPVSTAAGQPASSSDLAGTAARYDRVATDPAFKVLADRPEFRETHDLLRNYITAVNAAAAAAQPAPTALPVGLGNLPPPPPHAAPAIPQQ